MESFVARHVVVQLMHDGDLEGDDSESESTDMPKTKTGLLCMNRRETWTVAIYVMALIPAIIFDDLGPVLSITGALGGSCIAYFGPGMVYLGVNGESFLLFASELLNKWGERQQHKDSLNPH